MKKIEVISDKCSIVPELVPEGTLRASNFFDMPSNKKKITQAESPETYLRFFPK